MSHFPLIRPDIPPLADWASFLEEAYREQRFTNFGPPSRRLEQLLCETWGGPDSACVDIGSGERLTLNAIINYLNKRTNQNIPIVRAQSRPSEVRHSQADIGNAEKEIGYRPRINTLEGLDLTLEWQKAQHIVADQINQE